MVVADGFNGVPLALGNNFRTTCSLPATSFSMTTTCNTGLFPGRTATLVPVTCTVSSAAEGDGSVCTNNVYGEEFSDRFCLKSSHQIVFGGVTKPKPAETSRPPSIKPRGIV